MVRALGPAMWAVFSVAGLCQAQPTLRLIYPSLHPERGLIAYGDVSLTVDAIDSVFGIERVDFYIDGERVFSDETYPYSYLWQTGEIRRGLYQVKVTARNGNGRTTTIEENIEVVPSPAKRRTGGSAVAEGLLPEVLPLLTVNMRDPAVTVGPDGVCYLTGTTGHDPSDMNGGVELWRSEDMMAWEYVGLIWSFDRDGTWQRPWSLVGGKPVRAAWTPQLAYVRGNYHLIFGVPGRGTALLASTTGKPEGPYRNVVTDDQPLTNRLDASLFEDDDGTVYLVYGGGMIVPLDQRWNTAAAPKRIGFGDGGARMFKRDGRYYLAVAKQHGSGRCSSFVGWSDTPLGPFDDWHEAVPCGGHGGFFQDAEGRWWCTFFGSDDQAPWIEWPALLRVHFSDGERLTLVGDTPTLGAAE